LSSSSAASGASDEDAQREQCRTADAVRAMDEDAFPAIEMARRELDAAIEVGTIDGAHVVRRQMKRRDAVCTQQRFVVGLFAAQVDHRANAVLTHQAVRVSRGKAAADREVVGDPVEVRLPVAHRSRAL
jgi:hypothetical protein